MKKVILLLAGILLLGPIEMAESNITHRAPLEEITRGKEIEEWIVTATTYNPLPGQTNSDPTLTADMSRIDLHKLRTGKLKWIAVSRDFLRSGKLRYGDKVEVKCKQRPDLNGTYEVHDTMNKRFRNKIDILLDVSAKGGLFTEVVVRKINEKD